MDENFVFSKRLLYATIFGVIVIGGALYISQQEPVTQVPKSQEENSTKTETFTTISTEPEAREESANAPRIAQAPELTETDILTRNVLEPYLSQASTDTYSAENGDRIIANATKEMFTLDLTLFEAKDIITSQNITQGGATQYKRGLYTAIKPIFELEEYELTLYARAVQDNSKEDFDALLAVADIYAQAGEEALLVAAPNDVSAVHLAIINSLHTFSIVLSALAKGYDDPAASLAGTGNFTEAEESISQAFSQLQTYFILKEVDKTSI